MKTKFNAENLKVSKEAWAEWYKRNREKYQPRGLPSDWRNRAFKGI